LTLFKVFIKH